MSPKRLRWVHGRALGAIAAGVLILSGCSAVKAATHWLHTTDHFLTFESDDRIRYEPGAEKFASAVALALPSAVKKVESRQYSAFTEKIRLYLCNSPESFKKMTGRDVSALAYRKSIFLSPKLLNKPQWLNAYLAHELSHLLLYQKIGGYAYLRIPAWFAEGLAVYVSDGGGAEKVTDADAWEAIGSGNHFLPLEKAGLRDLFFPKYASYWGIKHRFKHHLFYRQCMLFVSYLQEKHPDHFRKLLTDVHNNMDFSTSFQASYGVDTMVLWHAFKMQIKDLRRLPAERS